MAVKGTKEPIKQDCRQYYNLGTDFDEDFECDEAVDVPIERLKLTLREDEEKHHHQGGEQ